MSSELPADVVESVQALSEYFGADELDPELEDYLIDDGDGHAFIKHPLVFSIYHQPMLNRSVNKQLAWKRQVIDEYIAASNWHGYIMAHERPYRMDALMSVADLGNVSDDEWWELVGIAWADSENIRQYPDAWDQVLRSDRPGRHSMMEDYEHAEYDALPDVIDVYQGCTIVRDDGWSWSTDRAKAIWFANRFASLEQAPPVLREGKVNKPDVTAYLTRRNESEVIVAPEKVHVIRQRRLA